MTETPTAAELDISNDVRYAAYDTLLSARASGVDLGQAAAQVLDAVVRPVVASELRRIADEIAKDAAGHPVGLDDARVIRARADELDPPARQEN